MARLVNESGVMGDSFEATAENVKDIPFDQLIEAIHQTQVEMDVTGTTAKEASETVSGSFDSMKAAGANLVAGLGDANADIGALMENLGSTVEIFVSNVKGVLSTIWDNLPLSDFQKWIGVILTSAGPLLFTFGKVIKVISAIPGALGLLAGPVGVAIGILAGLVAVGLLIYDNWELIKSSTAFTSLVEVFEMVKNKFIEMKDAFLESEAFETIKQIFTDLGQAILDIDFVKVVADIQAFIDKWMPLILGITGAIGAFKLINGIISTFKTTIGLAKLGISAFSGGLALLTSPIGLAALAIGVLIGAGVLLWQNWDTIKAKLQELKDKFIADWNELKNIVGAAMTTLKDAALKDFNELKTGATTAVTTLKDAAIADFNELKTGASNATKTLKSSATSDFNELKTMGSNAMKTLKSAAVSDANQLKTGAGNAIKTLRSSAVSDFNQLKTMGSNAVNSLKNSITNGFNTAKSNAISSASTLKSSVVGAFNSMVATAGQKISELPGKVSEGFSQAISAASGFVSQAVSAGGNLISGFIQGVADKAGALVTSVKSAVGGAIDGAKALLGIHSPSRVFKQFGIYTDQGFIDGIDSHAGKAKKAMENMINGVVDVFDPEAFNATPQFDINGSIARSNAQVKSSVSHELKNNSSSRLENAIMKLADQNIYLDGDTLVGGTYSRYDKMGGNKTQLDGRWGR